MALRADHEAAWVQAWTRFHTLALRRHLWPCERERGRWVVRRAGEKRDAV